MSFRGVFCREIPEALFANLGFGDFSLLSSLEMTWLSSYNLVLNVIGSEAVADEIVGFHIQQAIEKAIKSSLTRIGSQYEFTHDLSILYRQAENNGLTLPASIDVVEELTVFAVQFRYLLYQEEQTFDRSAGLTLAEDFVKWADSIVETPVQPPPGENDKD